MNLSFRGCFRPALRPLCGALALAGLALAGCSGTVGHGNAPRNLVIVQPGTANTLASLRMYECLTSGLQANLYFTDNSGGNFTARVHWSSSNPGAVQVSNGDIPVGQTTAFYPNGALVPVGVGNAIITADYFGIVAQTAVSVGTPQSISIRGLVQNNYVSLGRYNDVNHTSTTERSTFSMGIGSTLQLAAIAVLDGVETDVTTSATWSFKNPNDSVATINQLSGLILAESPGGPLVPVANFPSCSLNNITNPANEYQLTVSPVQSLALNTEFPSQPADPTQPVSSTNPLVFAPLIVGNTEKISAIGTLANGDLQDLSSQANYTSSNTNALEFTGGTGSNILSALNPGPAILGASYVGGGSQIIAPSIEASAESLTLQTIYTCWSDPTQSFNPTNCPNPASGTSQPTPQVVAGSLTPVQFHAIGTYGTYSNGQVITQEVTRQTTWASGDTTLATISNTAFNSGQALGVAQGSVNITATNNNASNISQSFNQLIVQGTP